MEYNGVCEPLFDVLLSCVRLADFSFPSYTTVQVEMTQPGVKIEPVISPREKRLLEAKYKIFQEAIEIQRRWRKIMAEASEDA